MKKYTEKFCATTPLLLKKEMWRKFLSPWRRNLWIKKRDDEEKENTKSLEKGKRRRTRFFFLILNFQSGKTRYVLTRNEISQKSLLNCKVKRIRYIREKVLNQQNKNLSYLLLLDLSVIIRISFLSSVTEMKDTLK